MKELLWNKLAWLGALAGVALFAGCASHASFDRNTSRVALHWYDTKTVPCYGSIDIYRTRPAWPDVEGSWSATDYYGIYFAQPQGSAHEFYLKMGPEKTPHEVRDVRGTVKIDGRDLYVQVEYKNAKGAWNKPPINGHHRIDNVWPDDVPAGLKKVAVNE